MERLFWHSRLWIAQWLLKRSDSRCQGRRAAISAVRVAVLCGLQPVLTDKGVSYFQRRKAAEVPIGSPELAYSVKVA